MLYNAFLTLIVALMSNTTQGCHSGLRKRSLSIRAQGMTSFFSKCLSDSAGKEFRWHAITRFAIEDTTWYDETSGRFCRDLHDTDECWRAQLDFFVNPASKYSPHIKRCIREYASKGSRSLPHFAYDESFQSARSGRWKRALLGQSWFDRRRYVRPRFVPPARTTRTPVVAHYVAPLRTSSPPRSPSPPVQTNYAGNRRFFPSNSGRSSPSHSSNPFKSTKTPTARSQTIKPTTVRARFSDLSRYDQLYVSLLRNYQSMMQPQASTPGPANPHVVTQTSSTPLFKKTTGCDQSSRTRFEGCVNTGLDDPIETRKRSLMLDPDADTLSKDDLKSIFRFFRDSYSPCMDEQMYTPIRVCSAVQVRSQSASALMCLPSIMVRLVRKDSELRRIFQSCASRNS